MKKTTASRVLAGILAAISLIAASACGSSSTAPDTTSANAAVVGTYTLKTVDGAALPAPAKDEKGAVGGTFTSGSITLASNGSFNSILNYTITGGTAGNSPSSGTYSVSGSTLTFVVSGKSNVTAVFSGGNTLTNVNNTQTMVYTK